MGDVFGEAVSLGIALALGLGGCGGRVDQVNLGKEQSPSDPVATQGSGEQTEIASPTVVDPGGAQVGQDPAQLPACPMTRRADPRFDLSFGEFSRGAFSSDGSLLAVAGNFYNPLQVFGMADGSVFSAFEIPQDTSYLRVAFSPDNRLVAASGFNNALAVFRLTDGALVADLSLDRQNNGGIVTADFSHDGRFLVATGWRPVDVQIWSVVDFSRVRSMQTGTGVSAVRFSPDDTRLVTADWDTVTVWNVADGSRVWSRPLSSCEQLGEVMFSPDGSQVVSACNSGLNRILRASDGSLIQEMGMAPPGPGSVSYYDDDHILIGDDTRGARIWAREATGLFAPSCFLTSERPPPSGASPDGKEGPAVLATSPGGRQMYLHGNFESSSWIYEQAP